MADVGLLYCAAVDYPDECFPTAEPECVNRLLHTEDVILKHLVVNYFQMSFTGAFREEYWIVENMDGYGIKFQYSPLV